MTNDLIVKLEKKINFHHLILLLFPILLLLLNKDWIYPNGYLGFADEWLYTGYFLNLDQYLNTFGLLYFGSRLSWILPGYALYHLFSPIIAYVLLHLIYFYAALFSLYYIVKSTIGERSALFVSILMGTYAFFLWEIGDNYVMGAVITYFLLTLAVLTISAQSNHWKYWLILAGIFCALMIHANISTLIFIPTMIAYYFIANYKWQKNSLIYSIFYFLIGGLLITLILGIINYYLTGYFFFFLPQIHALFYYTSWINPWWQPLNEWIFGAYWLIFPVITIIGTILFLIIYKIRKLSIINWFTLFFQLNFIAFFGIMLIQQLTGKPVLSLIIYADLLIPVMFLSISTQIFPLLQSLTQRQFLMLSLFEGIICVIPFFDFNNYLYGGLFFLDKSLILAFFILSWLALLIISSLNLIHISKKVILTLLGVSIVLFCFFNALLYPLVFFGNGFDTRENGYLSVMDSAETIKNVVPDAKVKFWYNLDEKSENNSYGPIFQSVCSIYLLGSSQFNTKFPILDHTTSIKPSDNHTFQYTMKAPANPGTYQTSYQMVWDGHWWFGPMINKSVTVSPEPTGSAVIESNDLPRFFLPDRNYTVTLKLFNDGSKTWTSDEFQLLVRLMKENELEDTNNSAKLFTLPEKLYIAPGQNYTLFFNIASPSEPGNYSLNYKVIWLNQTNGSKEKSDAIQVVSDPRLSARVVYTNLPKLMTPGQRFNGSIIFLNDGILNWTPNNVHFQVSQNSDYPDNNLNLDYISRVLLSTNETVKPGEKYSLLVNFSAPQNAGKFNVTYKMMSDDSSVLSQSENCQIEVYPDELLPQASVISYNLPSVLIPNQEFPATITMQNTGSNIWDESSQIRLGAVNDQWGDSAKFNPIRITLLEGGTSGIDISWMVNNPQYKLVILSTKENALEIAQEKLNSIGIVPKVLAQKEIRRGKIKFYIIILDFTQ